MRIVKLTKETTKNILENMLKRSPSQYGEYESRVQAIIQNIKENGDEALFSYTKQFDKADINASNVKVTDEEFEGRCLYALITVCMKDFLHFSLKIQFFCTFGSVNIPDSFRGMK